MAPPTLGPSAQHPFVDGLVATDVDKEDADTHAANPVDYGENPPGKNNRRMLICASVLKSPKRTTLRWWERGKVGALTTRQHIDRGDAMPITRC